MATQDEYRAKAREALEKLQQQIDELKVQANLAGADARDRYDKAIEALRKRQAETRSKLDQAADATGDAFSTLADEIDTNVRSAGSAAKAGRKAFLAEWKKQREAREKLIDSA